MFLSPEQIIQSNDWQTQEVNVPEWGGKVLVRGLTSVERDTYLENHTKYKGMGKTASIEIKHDEAFMVARCLVDENGKQLFKPSDAVALGKKSATAIHRIIRVIEKLSGLDKDDNEDAEKNSEATQDSDSDSD